MPPRAAIRPPPDSGLDLGPATVRGRRISCAVPLCEKEQTILTFKRRTAHCGWVFYLGTIICQHRQKCLIGLVLQTPSRIQSWSYDNSAARRMTMGEKGQGLGGSAPAGALAGSALRGAGSAAAGAASGIGLTDTSATRGTLPSGGGGGVSSLGSEASRVGATSGVVPSSGAGTGGEGGSSAPGSPSGGEKGQAGAPSGGGSATPSGAGSGSPSGGQGETSGSPYGGGEDETSG